MCVFVWVCDWCGSGLCRGKRVCVNRSMCVKAGQRVGSGLREQMLPDWPHAQAEHSSGDQETHQIVNCHNEDQHSQHYANNSPCYHTSLDWNWEKKREYKVVVVVALYCHKYQWNKPSTCPYITYIQGGRQDRKTGNWRKLQHYMRKVNKKN